MTVPRRAPPDHLAVMTDHWADTTPTTATTGRYMLCLPLAVRSRTDEPLAEQAFGCRLTRPNRPDPDTFARCRECRWGLSWRA